MNAVDVQAIYPLTPTQHGMLVDALGTEGAYVEQLACTIEGAFDVERFERAWREVVARHDALRTSFVWKRAERPMQVVHKAVAFSVARREGRLEAVIEEERARGVDLSRAPGMRVVVVPDADVHHVVWTHHHILLDGWSVAIVLGEVLATYDARGAGRALAAPRPRPFKDFVAWAAKASVAGAEAFWRARFAGLGGGLALSDVAAADASAGAARGTRASVSAVLDRATTAALTSLARGVAVTPSALVQAAWSVVVAHVTGERDVVFGVTSAGRPPELDGVMAMVGLFVSTLPLRVRLPEPACASVLDVARALHEGAADARAHEQASLVDVLAWTGTRSRLDGVVVFESYPVTSLASASSATSLKVRDVRPIERTPYAWMLVVGPGEETSLRLDVDPARIGVAQADVLVRALASVLSGLARGVLEEVRLLEGVPVSAMRGPDEPESDDFVAQIRARAAEEPAKVAVASEDGAIGYGELVRRADAIAAGLGVATGARVGVAVGRGVDLPPALLGILLAGAAYVPLDPSGPAPRARAMIEAAEVEVVLADRASEAYVRALGRPVVLVEDVARLAEERPRSAPGALAYVLFTSGSTGTPKGVLVTRASVTNLLRSVGRVVELVRDDVWLAVTPLSFDIAALEIWGPLTHGATVHVASERVARDPELLAARIGEVRPTVLQATPSTFRMVTESGALAEAPRGLRVLVGGEALAPGLAAHLLAWGGPVWNVYGPTETTIWSTIHRVTPDDTTRTGYVPIGRPLARTEAHVVNAAGRRVPPGFAGELLLGGAGLACGYAGDLERTRARFVETEHGRLYRTGDRVRIEAGALVWLGRDDGQLKVRGHRVEIGEVESALERCSVVREGAVVAEADAGGHPELAAFVVVRDASVDVASVRAALLEVLPEPLVPSRIAFVDALPRTSNGKIDRGALARGDLRPGEGRRGRPPRTPTEEILASIWSDVLGRVVDDTTADFFQLGGHSLLATQVAARVRKAFGVELSIATLFRATRLEALAARVEEARAGGSRTRARPPLVRVARQRGQRFPLTSAQARLWFIDRLEPGASFYNLPAAVRVTGELDLARLERALRTVVARHEALRTTFDDDADGVPFQVVHDEVGVPFTTRDLRGATEAEVLAVAREEVLRPFDLRRGPLVRALVVVRDGEHVVVVTTHHIVSDNWSIGVLVRELSLAHAGAPLPELAVQVPDVAVWRRACRSGPDDPETRARLDAMRERLASAPPLALPTDRPRPAEQRFRGARHAFVVAEETTTKLLALSRRCSSTPFMTLLAAFHVLLARLGGEPDVTVGVPVANRDEPELEPLVGFFANTLVLRMKLAERARFLDAVDAVRETALAAFANADVPFEQVVEHVNPSRSRTRSPLFQAMFVYQSAPRETLRSAGLAFLPLEPDVGTSKVDLELTMMPRDGEIHASFEWDTDLFDAETIARTARRFVRLLEAVVAAPDALVADVELDDADTRAEEARFSVGPSRPYDLEKDVASWFEAQVDVTPDRVALVVDGAPGAMRSTLTYRELDERASAFAEELAARGVSRGDRVGLELERSAELVVAVLGTLKLGAAYVPLEPALPRARREEMAQGVRVVVRAGEVAEGRVPRRAWPRGSRDLAYVIFTSGSTGRPKGVMSEHAGLVNRLAWMQEAFELGADDAVVQKTPIGFDVSVWELLWPLVTGARLVMARPEEHRDPRYLSDLFARERVTVAHFVPSMLSAVVDTPAASLAPLRLLVSSGEALTPSLVARVRRRFPALPIENLYGPTEASIDVTRWSVPPGSVPGEIPIGRPVANTYVRVLDERGRTVPFGAPGELCLGGVQLARGYLDDPVKTASLFVVDPKDPSARLYRTGDRARFRGDGALLHLGRLDDQVKVRGVRIELGEVEHELARIPEVREAAVVVRGEADRAELVAFVTPAREALQEPREDEHVAGWSRVFDDAYRRSLGASSSPAFHLGGWTRASDGAAIPEEEMRAWADEIVERVLALGPRSVLELGCGTGLLALALAGRGVRYVGTDVSGEAVAHVRAEADALGLRNVEVSVGSADAPPPGAFDVVLLSSVVQYFPSVVYLDRVLAAAATRIGERGAIVVADVRSLPLLGRFAESVERARDPGAPLDVLAMRARAKVAAEEELVLDPRYFASLAVKPGFERVRGAATFVKASPFDNEMSVFRFDVVLDVGGRFPPPPPRATTWAEVGSLEGLDRLRGEPVVVTAIPNARFVPGGVRAEELFARGARAAWDPTAPEDGALQAIFGGALDAPCAPSRDHANRPWEAACLRTLPRRAREHLRERLPEAMVPSSIVVVAELPHTPSGKIDRRALPDHGAPRRREGVRVAPRTAAERVVHDVFVDLLGTADVSVDDSFFDLGGHSLLATQLVARLREATRKDVPLRAVFEDKTVAALARLVDESSMMAADPACRAPAGPSPLSFAQRRMVVLDALAAAPGTYNVPAALHVRGALDREALRRAIAEVIVRHETLRTRIVPAEPEPLAEPTAPYVPSLEPVDVDARDVSARVAAEARAPFDLATGGLLRATLLRVRADEHVLVLVTHHVVSDRWSMGILVREITALYRGETLPPLDVSYRDLAVSERRRGHAEADVAYWKRALEGAPPVIELPTDRPRPPRRSSVGARTSFRLTGPAARAVARLAAARDATPFMVHFAAFTALLHRAGAGEDLVVGTPVAGRLRPEAEPLVGLFVNTLALRARVSAEVPFGDHLARVRETALEGFARQGVPFEAVARALSPARSLEHDPVVQVMLVVQNVPRTELELPGATVVPIDADTSTAKTDLTLFVEDDACAFEWDADLFDPPTVAALARAYDALLAGAGEDEGSRIASLPLVSASERERLLALGRGERVEIPGVTISDAIAEVCARLPGRTAIRDGGRSTTYGELGARVSRLAASLARGGARRGAYVAVALPRSTDAIAVILAVFASGAAYVPLEPSHPEARRAQIVAQLAPVIVVDEDALTRLDAESVDGVPASPAIEDVAYVIATSGTTGTPKPVAVGHRALRNHMDWMARAFPTGEGDRVLLRTSLAFDASIWELFAPLLAGATVVVASASEGADPVAIVELCRAEEVTVLQLVPTLLAAVVETGASLPATLRRVFAGGEPLPASLVAAFVTRSEAELVNLYGPTEATIDATSWRCERAEPGPVPIGRPIANTTVRVVDAAGGLVPQGLPGELYLGGEGLALGYVGDLAATRDRFVPDPFAAGERMYRTGDRVRMREDGALVHLGRRDEQVKIGGVRAELGEIEAAILAHPDVVAAAVVVLLEPRRLAAFVVERRAITDAELAECAATRLPRGLVPSTFVRVDELLRTSSGKVDRRALAAWKIAPVAATPGPPLDETGRTLARVIASVLGVPVVGPDDDFFELGGDSIASLHVVARARAAGLVLTPRDVFEAPTVRGLAPRAMPAVTSASAGTSEGRVFPLTPVQRWFFGLDLPNPSHWNQSVLVEVPGDVDRAKLAAAVARVVQEHAMLRARFGGSEGAIAPAEERAFTVVQTDAAGLSAEAGRVQASLDLVSGPVFRVVLFDLGEGCSARLLLVAHHLVVDAVSWRILQEDLLAAYAGAAPSAASTPFAAWAHEANALLPPSEPAVPSSFALPHDGFGGAATEATAEVVSLALDEAETARLVRARGPRAELVLLAGLVSAVADFTSADAVPITVERHGRDLVPALDVSRTVGWFTRFDEVTIPVAPSAAQLVATREALLSTPAAVGPPPASSRLVFNYLGRLDVEVEGLGALAPATEGRGRERSADAPMPFAIDLTGGVSRGVLRLDLRYSAALHAPATMAALAERLLEHVRAHLDDAGAPSAEDFPEAELDARQLDRVLDAIGRRRQA